MRFRLMLFMVAFFACTLTVDRTAAQSLTFPEVDSPVLYRDHVDACGKYVESILESSFRTMGFNISDDDWKTMRDLLYLRPYSIEEYAAIQKTAGRNQMTNLVSIIASSYHPMIEPLKKTSIRQNQLAALSRVPAYQFLMLLSAHVDPAKESWYVPLLREVGEKTLREYPLRGDEARILVSLGRFLSSLGEPALNYLFDAWEPAGGLDRWCREYLMARAHHGAGTSSMSGRVGYDTAVSEFALAEPHLLAAHGLAPNRPEPAAMLGVIAGFRGEPVGGRSMAEWFDLSFRAEYDRPRTIELARNVLAIDPDGADRALLTFAMSGAKGGQWETRVPWEIIDILHVIDGRRRDYRIYQVPGLWSVAQQMSGAGAGAEFANRFVDEETLREFTIEAAIGAREWDAAVEAVREWTRNTRVRSYAPEDDLGEWSSAKRRPLYAERIFPYLTGHPDELSEADELVKAGRKAEAADIYREILKSGIEHPYGRAFVVNRITTNLLGEALYTEGQWAPFDFEPGIPGWSLMGYFLHHVSDDGWLTMDEGEGTGRGNLSPIVCPAVPYEIEGEFRFGGAGNEPMFITHDVLGWSIWSLTVTITLSGEQRISAQVSSRDPKLLDEPLSLSPGVHTFRYRVEPKRVTAWIDDREFLIEGFEPDAPLRRTLRLNARPTSDVAHRNIRIREMAK